MSEELPPPPVDEPLGDVGDQASRLQMAEEQEAIRAALAGHVHGSDALEDRGPVISHLEGDDALDAAESDSSDDPVHGGGLPVHDEPVLPASDDPLDPDLTVSGLADDLGGAVAVEEGSSVEDDARAEVFELDGDPDILDEEIEAVDDEQEAEDLDALIDVLPPSHDLDDPRDPDGYGVPPAPGRG